MAGVIDADGATVTLDGELAVGSSFDVASLVGDFGELHGPGTTTVTDRLAGYWLTLLDDAVVDMPQEAVTALGGEIHVYDGSRLNVQGDAVLEDDAVIDSWDQNPGLFTITPTGSLTFAGNSSTDARVIGGFANHGEVTATGGYLLMMGASPEEAHPDQFSSGTFTGAPGTTFNVSNTELRTGARLDHVTWVDHITVPAGNTVTAADSGLVDIPDSNDPPPPSILGAGELVVTDESSFNYASIGGSLTVTVPAGEVFTAGDVAVEDHARLNVVGELAQWSDIDLEDDAVLDIYGVHRAAQGGLVDFTGTDPGLEVIHPAGQLLASQDGAVSVIAPFVNEGTVDSGTGWIYLGPRAASPSSSSGTFRADPAGTLYLGSNVEGDPPLALDRPVIEGAVDVSGPVTAENTDVRGELSTAQGGRLALDGTTTMADGASIAGDVTVSGTLEADPGATGTATLSGAEVTGSVRAVSGTLSVPSLAPSTLGEEGTLTKGHWAAAPGATLDLPAVTTNDTEITFEGPGASFGDGLATLTDTGRSGALRLLDGAHTSVPGPFTNEGTLELSSGSRLRVGARFAQLTTGTLVTDVDGAGRGRIRAEGPRDLAGRLEVRRDPAYEPPVGTVLNFITSDGAKGADDAFESVVSPKYGSRKVRVDYGVDKVRLWVDRVG